jgi:hypothetical protein
MAKQTALSSRRQEHLLQLPDPLPKANIREFPRSRKCDMTGHEAAIAVELDIRQAEHRALMEDIASSTIEKHIKTTRVSRQLIQEVAAAFLCNESLIKRPILRTILVQRARIWVLLLQQIANETQLIYPPALTPATVATAVVATAIVVLMNHAALVMKESRHVR